MPQQPLLILNAVDVRRATENGVSRATTIATLTIPKLTFVKSPHSPGGGVGEVDFTQPRIEKLEPAFTSKGIDLEIFAGMGVTDRWSFAAAYTRVDGTTRRKLPARGIIEGAVTEWEPDESDPAEFKGCSHMFSEVTHFEFSLGDEELIYFDFFERAIRRKGVDLFADVRQALGA